MAIDFWWPFSSSSRHQTTNCLSSIFGKDIFCFCHFESLHSSIFQQETICSSPDGTSISLLWIASTLLWALSIFNGALRQGTILMQNNCLLSNVSSYIRRFEHEEACLIYFLPAKLNKHQVTVWLCRWSVRPLGVSLGDARSLIWQRMQIVNSAKCGRNIAWCSLSLWGESVKLQVARPRCVRLDWTRNSVILLGETVRAPTD